MENFDHISLRLEASERDSAFPLAQTPRIQIAARKVVEPVEISLLKEHSYVEVGVFVLITVLVLQYAVAE